MELHVVDTEGIPEGCVLSVRAGSTRRQAPVAADRPFRFPTPISEALPFKVDVLEPVASARLILRPGEEKRTDCQYTIPLEGCASGPDGLPLADQKGAKDGAEPEMSVTIAVQPSPEEQKEHKKDDKPVASAEADEGSRPGSSSKAKRGTSGVSAASRHGQASAAREYLDQHNLVEFTQLLVQSVIKEQPDRPYAFMAKQFYFPDPQPRPGYEKKEAPPAAASPAAPAAAEAQATVMPSTVAPDAALLTQAT